MTAIIEAIVWFCAGTAAGLAVAVWLLKSISKLQDEIIDDLLAANQRLRGHIAMLEKSRKADSADWWKDN